MEMKQHNLATKFTTNVENNLVSSKRNPNSDAGLIKLKIDAKVFEVLKRKRRAGETLRMALERTIMTL
jgi:hypothetical protein